MNKNLLILVCLLFMANVHAQETTSLESASLMHQNGKIYVVITVIALVFLSLVGFLVYLERRISKMEKKANENGAGAAQNNQPRH